MSAVTEPRRTQRDRRNESDARILNAAIELIAAQGFQKTTLVQIGEAAGYTGTLISNRFGSKDQLLFAVLDHIINRFETDPAAEQLRKTLEDRTAPVSAKALLSDFIGMYLRDVADNRSRIRALHVIMGEALGALPQVHELIVRANGVFRARVEDYLAYGIRTGEFRSGLDTAEAAVIIVGLLRGVTMQALAEQDAISAGDMIAPVQASVLAAVCRRD